MKIIDKTGPENDEPSYELGEVIKNRSNLYMIVPTDDGIMAFNLQHPLDYDTFDNLTQLEEEWGNPNDQLVQATLMIE